MNFDNTPSRDGTFAYKWEKYKGRDILPAWIADTEYPCAQPIMDALTKRVEHGALGYTLPKHHAPAVDAIVNWCAKQYDWQIHANWIVWTPGVVPAFNMACKAYCKPGDSVIVQTPNYPPLLAAPALNGLHPVCINTILKDNRYTLDFDTLEVQAAKPECKLFILCNPMNPVGSVLSKDELNKVAAICNKHSVMICSDEIHCDLILDDVRHIPVGAIDCISDSSITLMAASKTFNVAGLGTSFAIIPNANVRAKFINAGAGIVPWPNVLGIVAVEAAFNECNEWREQQLSYLRTNRNYLVNAINQIDGLSAMSPQATFLLWVNASGLGVSDTQAWCENKGVGPSAGKDFGDAHCFRLNFGCSFDYVQQMVHRIKA
jgi:cystathionine beta-lyase